MSKHVAQFSIAIYEPFLVTPMKRNTKKNAISAKPKFTTNKLFLQHDVGFWMSYQKMDYEVK